MTTEIEGRYFTPREVIRGIDPKPSIAVFGSTSDTGGFLVEAIKHMREFLGQDALAHFDGVVANPPFGDHGREVE